MTEETPGLPISEELFAHLPVPALRGSIEDGVLVVSSVNGAFGELWPTQVPCPCTLETLFAGLPGPRDFTPLTSGGPPGWRHVLWELVPGENLVDLALYSAPEGEIVAVMPECSEQMTSRRFHALREKVFFLLRLHHAHEALAPLTSCITEFFGFDWTGILQWDSASCQWTPLTEAPHPFLLAPEDRRLESFLARLARDPHGEASGSRLGGLSVEEGAEWWVRWSLEGGEWRDAMAEADLRSLFAGTLLGGTQPLVFLALSRREGALGRINGDALRALWPTLCSTAERYRATKAMAYLAQTDPETGLMAETPLRRRLQEELRRSRRYGYFLSLVRLTLLNAREMAADDPENVADAMRSMGHDMGQSIRNVDVAGRTGPHAVVLALPHTDAPGRKVVEGRLKDRISATSLFLSLPPEISLEGATFPDDGTPETFDEALGLLHADDAPLTALG
ncbi:MAG TPA: hypothetical protein PK393_03070 [Synergistaceae bacterium]|nr:hypothetical protein [Synergistaceae bacterium]